MIPPASKKSISGIPTLNREKFSLIYFLIDSRKYEEPPQDWRIPSGQQKIWLYDEVSKNSQFKYFLHDILFSDGSTITIPFFDVVVATSVDEAFRD